MLTPKKFFGNLLTDLIRKSSQNHKILDGLTKYAINYFKDKVEPNKNLKHQI